MKEQLESIRQQALAALEDAATPAALEELRDCVSGKESVEGELIRRETLRSINCFLGTLTAVERSVFLCRYWYLDSSQEIAAKSGFSETKVRSMLCRLRIRLDKHLEKEGLR